MNFEKKLWIVLFFWLNSACLVWASPTTLEYRIVLEGVEESTLLSLLEESSTSRTLMEHPPETKSILRHRAMQDEKRLAQALNSRGYLDALVTAQIDFEVSPILLTFHIDLGPLYRFEKLSIITNKLDANFIPPPFSALGLHKGGAAISRLILDANPLLMQKAQEQGYAFAVSKTYQASIDREKHLLDLELYLELGSKIRLGRADFTGVETVEKAYLQEFIHWQPGQLYHPATLEKLRKALVQTNLFGIVRVALSSQADQQGFYPVLLTLMEKKPRTVRGGLRFSTDTGLGVTGGWEHRNFLGKGENLVVDGQAALNAQSLKTTLGKSHFLIQDQTVLGSLLVQTDDTDAYDRTSVETAVGLERSFTSQIKGSLSCSYRLVDLTEKSNQTQNNYGLLSLPTKLEMDTSNDLLDPKRGWRLTLRATPYVETLENGSHFGKLQLEHRRYMTLKKAPQFIFAGRVSVGSLLGAEREKVPADERFYVGGGGSLRGYAYQLAGPLDVDQKPLGGISALEMGGEMRIRVSESIELATFLEAGRAYESVVPDFNDAMFVGVGVGMRYHSPVGPFRIDVAMPLDKRDGVKDDWQFYLSLGQAF
ncbi:MAG: autotransporter assembly complex protein TamA [Magnetococcus sp. DMHC-6]